MSKTTKQIVIPGEEITTEEEYAQGSNTFTQNGLIKSNTIGTVTFDDTTKEVHVSGKGIQLLTIGDIVYGKITLVKESTAIVELKRAENNKKILTPMATLAVRSVSTQFVSDLHAMFKIGDLIKAKITAISPLGTDIATNETGLGVIKAYCSNCRHVLTYSNSKLLCFNCGNQEERRWFEEELTAREFRPRDDSDGERREFRPRREFGERPRFGERRGYNDNRGSFGNRRFNNNRSFSNGSRES